MAQKPLPRLCGSLSKRNRTRRHERAGLGKQYNEGIFLIWRLGPAQLIEECLDIIFGLKHSRALRGYEKLWIGKRTSTALMVYHRYRLELFSYTTLMC